jgi:hypothetical protein
MKLPSTSNMNSPSTIRTISSSTSNPNPIGRWRSKPSRSHKPTWKI